MTAVASWDGSDGQCWPLAGCWQDGWMAGENGGMGNGEGEQDPWLAFVVDGGWGFICINPVTLQRIGIVSLSLKCMKL